MLEFFSHAHLSDGEQLKISVEIFSMFTIIIEQFMDFKTGKIASSRRKFLSFFGDVK